MAEKKEGVNLGRSTNEKITDTAREGFESVTGYVPFCASEVVESVLTSVFVCCRKDVPDKFSN
jgi:hypothetical protein